MIAADVKISKNIYFNSAFDSQLLNQNNPYITNLPTVYQVGPDEVAEVYLSQFTTFNTFNNISNISRNNILKVLTRTLDATTGAYSSYINEIVVPNGSYDIDSLLSYLNANCNNQILLGYLNATTNTYYDANGNAIGEPIVSWYNYSAIVGGNLLLYSYLNCGFGFSTSANCNMPTSTTTAGTYTPAGVNGFSYSSSENRIVLSSPNPYYAYYKYIPGETYTFVFDQYIISGVFLVYDQTTAGLLDKLGFEQDQIQTIYGTGYEGVGFSYAPTDSVFKGNASSSTIVRSGWYIFDYTGISGNSEVYIPAPYTIFTTIGGVTTTADGGQYFTLSAKDVFFVPATAIIYLVLDSLDLPDRRSNSTILSNTNILAAIPCNAAAGLMVNYQPPVPTKYLIKGPRTIGSMNIRLMNDTSNLLDLNGGHFFFTMTLDVSPSAESLVSDYANKDYDTAPQHWPQRMDQTQYNQHRESGNRFTPNVPGFMGLKRGRKQ